MQQFKILQVPSLKELAVKAQWAALLGVGSLQDHVITDCVVGTIL